MSPPAAFNQSRLRSSNDAEPSGVNGMPGGYPESRCVVYPFFAPLHPLLVAPLHRVHKSNVQRYVLILGSSDIPRLAQKSYLHPADVRNRQPFIDAADLFPEFQDARRFPTTSQQTPRDEHSDRIRTSTRFYFPSGFTILRLQIYGYSLSLSAHGLKFQDGGNARWSNARYCPLRGRQVRAVVLLWKRQRPIYIWWVNAGLRNLTVQPRPVFLCYRLLHPESMSPRAPSKVTAVTATERSVIAKGLFIFPHCGPKHGYHSTSTPPLPRWYIIAPSINSQQRKPCEWYAVILTGPVPIFSQLCSRGRFLRGFGFNFPPPRRRRPGAACDLIAFALLSFVFLEVSLCGVDQPRVQNAEHHTWPTFGDMLVVMPASRFAAYYRQKIGLWIARKVSNDLLASLGPPTPTADFGTRSTGTRLVDAVVFALPLCKSSLTLSLPSIPEAEEQVAVTQQARIFPLRTRLYFAVRARRDFYAPDCTGQPLDPARHAFAIATTLDPFVSIRSVLSLSPFYPLPPTRRVDSYQFRTVHPGFRTGTLGRASPLPMLPYVPPRSLNISALNAHCDAPTIPARCKRSRSWHATLEFYPSACSLWDSSTNTLHSSVNSDSSSLSLHAGEIRATVADSLLRRRSLLSVSPVGVYRDSGPADLRTKPYSATGVQCVLQYVSL
ncbi:hypothetical protein C8R43DRAFT_959842 [Mycena crocata]|nr:hypothetical protein C8R43DRAFT_959842 [Mycena crocata]